MGNNRLLREKWDFSRLSGFGLTAPTDNGIQQRWYRHAGLSGFLIIAGIALLVLPQLASPLPRAAIAGAGILGWLGEVGLRFAALGFPIVTVFIAFPLLVWLSLIGLWFPRWLITLVLWMIDRMPGRTRSGIRLRRLPPASREWGALTVVSIGLAALLLAFLQLDDDATRSALSWLLPPERAQAQTSSSADALEEILRQIANVVSAATSSIATALHDFDAQFVLSDEAERLSKVFGGALAALVTIVGASALVEFAGELTDNKGNTPEQEKILSRLSRWVKRHSDLGQRPKIVAIGSKPKQDAQKVTGAQLLEIWLGMPEYSFDPIELLNLIDSRMQGDLDDSDVVIIEGRTRKVIVHEVLSKFRTLLAGDTLASRPNPLAVALARQDRSALGDLLDANTVPATETNLSAVNKMVAAGKKRILVVARDGHYLGFCKLEEVFAEVFAK